MSEEWEYISGTNATTCVRVYRKGPIGKVTRTRRKNHGFGKGVVKYFVWDLPDSSPEYDTEAEAMETANA